MATSSPPRNTPCHARIQKQASRQDLQAPSLAATMSARSVESEAYAPLQSCTAWQQPKWPDAPPSLARRNGCKGYQRHEFPIPQWTVCIRVQPCPLSIVQSSSARNGSPLFTPHFTSRNCKEAELGGCLPCTAGAQQNRMLDSSAIPKITVSTETTGSCQERGTTFRCRGRL